MRKPLAEKDSHRWLQSTLEEEEAKVAKLIPKGAKAYYLLTNVPATGHLDAGSLDKVQKMLGRAIPLPSRCFWRDDITWLRRAERSGSQDGD